MRHIIFLLFLIVTSSCFAQKKSFSYINTDNLMDSFPDWKEDYKNIISSYEITKKKYGPLITKCMKEVEKGQKEYSRITRQQYFTAKQEQELRSKFYLKKYAECEQLNNKMVAESKKNSPKLKMYSKIFESIKKNYKQKSIELIAYSNTQLKQTNTINDIKENDIKDVTNDVISKIKSHIKKYKTLKMASLMKVE